MADTQTPRPSRALSILQLITALLPVATVVAQSLAKSDKAKQRVGMATDVASGVLPVVTGILAANQK